jgi:DNA-binding LytR/AlgR family response regulator
MAVTRIALVRKLTKSGYHVVGSSATAEGAWSDINENSVDIILIDINLAGEKDGVWLGNKIKNFLKIPFVYLTAYGDASTLKEVVNSKPNGYLSKPYNESSLLTTLTIAIQNFEESLLTEDSDESTSTSVVFVKVGNVILKLNYTDIIYVQSDGNYIKIKTTSDLHIVREKLSAFQVKLPGPMFKRVHNRYVVNCNKIDKFIGAELTIGDAVIPVSTKYKKLLSLT